MSDATQIKFHQRIFGWLKKFIYWALAIILIYLCILIVGMIPVNNDFVPAEDGVKIYLISNPVHSDIILPIESDGIDWLEEFEDSKFIERFDDQSHISIGWGDKGFFLETPTWDDFKLSTAVKALLLPSDCCTHVSFVNPNYYSDVYSVSISNEQYLRLVEYIRGSFKRNADGAVFQIQEECYSNNDAFFEAAGNYHIFNTCNSWVGGGLKATGVRAPWLSPMPKTPMFYLESE